MQHLFTLNNIKFGLSSQTGRRDKNPSHPTASRSLLLLLNVVSIVLSTMEFVSLHSILLVVTLFLIFYLVWVACYRLYLSPIAKFPGPKLAAVTFWYELYHDVVRPGKYTWEIAKMHEQYGKISLITSID